MRYVQFPAPPITADSLASIVVFLVTEINACLDQLRLDLTAQSVNVPTSQIVPTPSDPAPSC